MPATSLQSAARQVRDMKAEEFVKAVSSGKKLSNGYGTTVEQNGKKRIFVNAPGYAVSADALKVHKDGETVAGYIQIKIAESAVDYVVVLLNPQLFAEVSE